MTYSHHWFVGVFLPVLVSLILANLLNEVAWDFVLQGSSLFSHCSFLWGLAQCDWASVGAQIFPCSVPLVLLLGSGCACLPSCCLSRSAKSLRVSAWLLLELQWPHLHPLLQQLGGSHPLHGGPHLGCWAPGAAPFPATAPVLCPEVLCPVSSPR